MHPFQEFTEKLASLRNHGVNVVTVVGEYHRRRYPPLMARTIPMSMVVAHDRIIDDTVMAVELLSDEETTRQMNAAVDRSALAWPVGCSLIMP